MNEAFASVPLAWHRRVRRRRRAGSTLAAARSRWVTRSAPPATRLATTLLDHLEQTGGRYGLQTMCEAGGMANAH